MISIKVRCNFCGETYDLTMVRVVGRYSDCTVFKTPCCDRIADDLTWKSMPDFTRIVSFRPKSDPVGYMYP